MQGNPSKKACISLDSFGRFGPFQCVMANPNEEVRFARHSPLRLCSGLELSLSYPALDQQDREGCQQKTITQSVDCRKRFAGALIAGGVGAPGGVMAGPGSQSGGVPAIHENIVLSG